MGLVSVDVRTAIGDGRFPIVLSGNCGTASGTLAGLTPSRRAVLWFDAHGDANTPDTTITGFVDGTALATALGWCWHGLADRIPGFEPVDASAVRLIGTRDLDSDEAALLDRAAVRRISPAELRGSALDDALASLPKGLQVYVHCDLDVLDPDEGQANVFPVPGGLDVETLVQAIGKIGSALPIAAAAVTAYAPDTTATDESAGPRSAPSTRSWPRPIHRARIAPDSIVLRSRGRGNEPFSRSRESHSGRSPRRRSIDYLLVTTAYSIRRFWNRPYRYRSRRAAWHLRSLSS